MAVNATLKRGEKQFPVVGFVPLGYKRKFGDSARTPPLVLSHNGVLKSIQKAFAIVDVDN